jgi:hypothetical protein
MLSVVVALPIVAFVWLLAIGEPGFAAVPLSFGLLLYGIPIGERLAKLVKSEQFSFAIISCWFLFLIAVGLTYFGWVLGLPFGAFTRKL